MALLYNLEKLSIIDAKQYAKFWSIIVHRLNDASAVLRHSDRVCQNYIWWTKGYRRIFSTMSFGLSKKSHNLNQYTLLSNLEGMFFVL